MKHKVPGTIVVMGKRYKCIRDDGALGDQELLGHVKKGESKIRYSVAGHSRDQLRDTILHEVLHAVDFAVALDLEEDQIVRLTTGIFSLLRDNPKFVKWLMDR